MKTDIVILLDKSMSMQRLTDDTLNGFNSFIKEQRDAKIDGEVRVTLNQFGTAYEPVFMGIKLEDVPELTNKMYVADGPGTALIDALAKSINEAENFTKDSDGVVFVIITDGQENASREYSLEQVRSWVERLQKDKGWTFIFLGANIDAFDEARQFGFTADNVSNYAAANTGVVYSTMAGKINKYRSTQDAKHLGFTNKERKTLEGDDE